MNGIDELLLDWRANQIEDILRHNGLEARVGGGNLGGYLVSYPLTFAPRQVNVLSRLERLAEDIARELTIEGPVSARRDQGVIRLEMQHGGPFQPVNLAALSRKIGQNQPQVMLLGVNLANQVKAIKMSRTANTTAHALVAGMTGSGKTALLKTMLTSLAANTPPEQAQLVLIDPKHNFAEFAGLPHLALPIAAGLEAEAEAALAALTGVIAEMAQREREHYAAPRLYVFIDELADLLLVGGKPLKEAVTRLTQKGREAGVHLIAGTQKPTVEAIGSLTAANFPLRIVGAVHKESDARVAAGLAGSGAEKLLGRGDFLLIYNNQVDRFQAAYADPAHIAAVVRQYAAAPPAHQQRVFEEHADAPARHTLLSKVLSFARPAAAPGPERRGGWNRQDFTAEQIADARRGLSEWQLRQKYKDTAQPLSGSRAKRLAQEYGPPAAETTAG